MSNIGGHIESGVWRNNAVLVQLLGLCPALAVTTNMTNGLGMGIASTFVLVGSNFVVACLRGIIPVRVRIPSFIVVIATFVTIVKLTLEGYFPSLYDALGIYIPLIVVNCMILSRAEIFASKNGIFMSIIDAIAVGLGFTFALAALGGVREFIGHGTILQMEVIPGWHSFMLMTFPPGAFLVLGFFLAGIKALEMRRAKREQKSVNVPEDFHCAHCQVCDLSKEKTGEE